MAAVAIAIGAGGALSSIHTTVLLTVEEMRWRSASTLTPHSLANACRLRPSTTTSLATANCLVVRRDRDASTYEPSEGVIIGVVFRVGRIGGPVQVSNGKVKPLT